MKYFFIIFLIVPLAGCNHLYYYPDQHKYLEPSQFKLKHEEFPFQTSQGRLAGWYLPANKKQPCKNTLVVHLHGNAQNISSHFLQLAWVVNKGMDYLIFDYPGYGSSEGEATRKKIHQASKEVLQQIFESEDPRIKGKKLIFYGQSLGGAILMSTLLELEQANKVKLAVFESTFQSYQRIARKKLAESWLTWPFQWLAYVLVTDTHSVDGKLSQIKVQESLVLHGTLDHIVDFSHGERIYKDLPEPKDFWSIEGKTHMQLQMPDVGVRERLVKKICQ